MIAARMARPRGRRAPSIIGDIDEIERMLTLMTKANPMVAKFVGTPAGPDGRLDRAWLEVAVRYGFRIIRWSSISPRRHRSDDKR